jgi:hypothetical protein
VRDDHQMNRGRGRNSPLLRRKKVVYFCNDLQDFQPQPGVIDVEPVVVEQEQERRRSIKGTRGEEGRDLHLFQTSFTRCDYLFRTKNISFASKTQHTGREHDQAGEEEGGRTF